MTEPTKHQLASAPLMAAPLIRKGDQVIVDGKLIAEAKVDIFSGDLCTPAQFQWFITPPNIGDHFGDTPGFRRADGQPDVFVSGEWLTERLRKSRESKD